VVDRTLKSNYYYYCFCFPLKSNYYYYYYFCLPVVFMGSKRYKKENAFDDFIAKHGGDNNAWTDTERVTRSRNLCCVQNNCAVLCIYI